MRGLFLRNDCFRKGCSVGERNVYVVNVFVRKRRPERVCVGTPCVHAVTRAPNASVPNDIRNAQTLGIRNEIVRNLVADRLVGRCWPCAHWREHRVYCLAFCMIGLTASAVKLGVALDLAHASSSTLPATPVVNDHSLTLCRGQAESARGFCAEWIRCGKSRRRSR